jgi:hypothetical protein
VRLHEHEADVVEAAADGHDLGQDLLAVTARLQHALDALDLALDAAKAGGDLFGLFHGSDATAAVREGSVYSIFAPGAALVAPPSLDIPPGGI